MSELRTPLNSPDPARADAELERLAGMLVASAGEISREAQLEPFRVLKSLSAQLRHFSLDTLAAGGGSAAERLLLFCSRELACRSQQACLASGADLTSLAGLTSAPWTGTLPLSHAESQQFTSAHGLLSLRALRRALRAGIAVEQFEASARACYLPALCHTLAVRAVRAPQRSLRELCATAPPRSQAAGLSVADWTAAYFSALTPLSDPRRPLQGLAARRRRAAGTISTALDELAT